MSEQKEVTAIVPTSFGETKALAQSLSASQLLPMALRKKPEDVMLIIMTGAELGFAPMRSLQAIHIIEGKPSLSSDAFGALVRRSPACEYLILSESTDKIATYKTKRRGSPGETVMSFTIQEAHKAGLLSKNNWAKYPAAMLRARAQAAICRAVFPDVCLGIYDADSGELDNEKPAEPSGMSATVASVAEAVKASVAAKPAEPEIEDAVFTELPKEEEKPAEAPASLEGWIRSAATVEALTALLPEIQKFLKDNPGERENLLAAYTARKSALGGK